MIAFAHVALVFVDDARVVAQSRDRNIPGTDCIPTCSYDHLHA